MKCEFCGKRAEAYINGRLACQEHITAFGVAALKANGSVLMAVKGEPKCMLLPKDTSNRYSQN